MLDLFWDDVMPIEDISWARPNGKPCKTVKGSAPGSRVKPSIVNAPKNELYPRVTSILNVLGNPGLIRYGNTQYAQAAWDIAAQNPGVFYDDAGQFVGAIHLAANFHKKKCAERGTTMHLGVEQWLKSWKQNGFFIAPTEDTAINAVCEFLFTWLDTAGITRVECERSFVSAKRGVAGTADIFAYSPGHVYIVDMKTSNVEGMFRDGKWGSVDKLRKKKYLLQMACYLNMLRDTGELGDVELHAYTLLVDRDTGRLYRDDLIRYDDEELSQAMVAFEELYNLFVYLNGYDARR